MRLRQAAFRVAAATTMVAAVAVLGVSGGPSARAAPSTHIAVIGDSYTAGSTEGGAGYGQPGSHGSVFQDLTARAVRRNDVLVVFFGSRNDQPVNPAEFPDMAAGTLHLARFAAPDARVLVIGPPWPTATPPPAVLTIRNSLRAQAAAIGATFVDPIDAGWFVGRPDLIGHDGVHPTDAGHVYLAEKIAPLIYSQLTIGI